MHQTRKKGEERNRYYRTIARYFFEQRGAPFFFSSKELEVVAEWEKTGIPLSTVLEGIKNAFARSQRRQGRRKVLSLVFCQPYVNESYELYKERMVGRKRTDGRSNDRGKRMKKEVQIFLESFPEEIGYLREVFLGVLREDIGHEPDEERLEQLEQELEELLLKNASSREKAQIKEEVLSEYRFQDGEEFERIFRAKLIRYLRDRFRIPHISLYYY